MPSYSLRHCQALKTKLAKKNIFFGNCGSTTINRLHFKSTTILRLIEISKKKDRIKPHRICTLTATKSISKKLTARPKNFGTIFRSQQTICRLRTNRYTLNTTMLIPHMYGNRITGHFHCTFGIFLFEKVTPVLPTDCVHLVHRKYAEAFTAIACHQCGIVCLANFLQHSCNDTGSIVAPVVAIEAVVKFSVRKCVVGN